MSWNNKEEIEIHVFANNMFPLHTHIYVPVKLFDNISNRHYFNKRQP